MVTYGNHFRRFMLFGVCQTETKSMARDHRIDMVRGLALLIIFINHMPGHVLAGYTPHNFGFSDAADIFVLLAGISATLAYGPVIDRKGFAIGALKVGARLWTLYIAHLAVFIIVCGVVAAAVIKTDNPLYLEAINIQPFFNETLAALGMALTLTFQPNYLDILPLYIVILSSFPLVYATVCVSPALTLLASVILWHVAGSAGINLRNGEEGRWFFNPFAWQLLFVIGVVVGRAMQKRVILPRLPAIDGLAAFIVASSLAIKLAAGNPFGPSVANEWIASFQLGYDKTNLAAVRVIHLLALAWLFIRFVPANARLLQVRAVEHVSIVGRNSLEVFCLGTVLSIIGHIAIAETSFALGMQVFIAAAGIGALIGFATFLTWYRSIAASARQARGSAGSPQVAI